jgi:hypothetical protein
MHPRGVPPGPISIPIGIACGPSGRQRALSSELGLQPRLPHGVLRVIGHEHLLRAAQFILLPGP